MPVVFPLSLQDSISALAHDLNYPALRKNKNIDAFLNRCKRPNAGLNVRARARAALEYNRQRPGSGDVAPVGPR